MSVNRYDNLALRRALVDARLRDVDVATALRVDPKTVQRWLAGRRPHAEHRWRVAELVGVPEHEIWPDSAAPTTLDRELVATFPRRSMVPRSTWAELFASATRQLDVLVYSGLFLAEDLDLLSAIAERAEAGVTVRLLVGDPDAPEVLARGIEEGIGEAMPAKVRNALVLYRASLPAGAVEIRRHRTVLYNSVFRADDRMLVNQHVFGVAAAQAPVVHLRRQGEGGLFDTYAGCLDRVWAAAAPAVITLPEAAPSGRDR